jgi:hypothetical protein
LKIKSAASSSSSAAAAAAAASSASSAAAAHVDVAAALRNKSACGIVPQFSTASVSPSLPVDKPAIVFNL